MDMRNISKEELKEHLADLYEEYETFKSMNRSLDMSRGKPGSIQLKLSGQILEQKYMGNFLSKSGVDCRNYGLLDGIDECKSIFSELLEVEKKNIIIFGNSSLNVMFDYISQCMLFGASGCTPWCKLDKVKFLCPVPGYDRHFSICELFGIEMINIPFKADGPDMDMIEELVKDESVKGVFCVPKYSNPNGITYSDEAVRRFAALRPAAKDFRVIWDNAYFVHPLYEEDDTLLNIFEACKEYGTGDHFIEVVSTSKITFPGSGVAVLAASDENIAEIKKRMTIQTIGHDKMNMLRHAHFFKDANGVHEHMKLHADIVRPKFELILDAFEKYLGGKGIAEWTNPRGGYFISLNVMNGCAEKVVNLCKEAGVTLTGAGATFPYGKDPDDRNIRIAPTYPSIDDLSLAVEILCVCIKIACYEKILIEKCE
ncbi:MAG: aminotransferase class I/II-fold pyridoxal phosphate-dependent enzyme [Clostridia bacterium]|nr:aminotransferase class I/II-fold pyridoxal phosphate-dependent enzyme [Clostridia bacterium]